jgi:hypothetical protein
MPRRLLQLKIMIVDPPGYESATSDDDESLTAVMKEFKEQMDQIEKVSESISKQVTQLYVRAKEETTDWLNEPLSPRPPLKEWLKERGLTTRPTMEEFLDACYAAAKSMDLESRVLVFHKADAAALWNGQRRLTVFEIIGLLPGLFY